jgi:hypothetical protein
MDSLKNPSGLEESTKKKQTGIYLLGENPNERENALTNLKFEIK